MELVCSFGILAFSRNTCTTSAELIGVLVEGSYSRKLVESPVYASLRRSLSVYIPLVIAHETANSVALTNEIAIL